MTMKKTLEKIINAGKTTLKLAAIGTALYLNSACGSVQQPTPTQDPTPIVEQGADGKSHNLIYMNSSYFCKHRLEESTGLYDQSGNLVKTQDPNVNPWVEIPNMTNPNAHFYDPLTGNEIVDNIVNAYSIDGKVLTNEGLAIATSALGKCNYELKPANVWGDYKTIKNLAGETVEHVEYDSIEYMSGDWPVWMNLFENKDFYIRNETQEGLVHLITNDENNFNGSDGPAKCDNGTIVGMGIQYTWGINRLWTPNEQFDQNKLGVIPEGLDGKYSQTSYEGKPLNEVAPWVRGGCITQPETIPIGIPINP